MGSADDQIRYYIVVIAENSSLCIITITRVSEMTRVLHVVISLWHSGVSAVELKLYNDHSAPPRDCVPYTVHHKHSFTHKQSCRVTVHHANTLANASAPALAMNGFDG